MGKVSETALARKQYKVTYKDQKGGTVKDEYELTLEESGASDYGNRHCLRLIRMSDKYVNIWDARYDKRFNDTENFFRYADEFMMDKVFSEECEVWGRVN